MKDENFIYFYRCLEPKIKNNLLITTNLYKTFFYNQADKFLLGFEELFLSLEHNDKIFLDDLYQYSQLHKEKYINRKIFISYVIQNNIKIPKMEETYIIRDISENKYNIDYNGKVIPINLLKYENKLYKNDKRKSLSTASKHIQQSDILANIFPNIAKKSFIFSVKKLNLNNNTNNILILAFLNWLFSSEENLYIKLCQRCNNYYVATKSDNKYCKRVQFFDNRVKYTCSTYRKKFLGTSKYKNFKKECDIFKNLINSKIDQNKLSQKYLLDFLNERDNIIEQALEKNDNNLFNNFVENYKNHHPWN